MDLVSEFEISVMGDLVETVEAWNMAHSPAAGELDAEGLLDLLLAAGYHEETAQRAATERAKQRLRAGLAA